MDRKASMRKVTQEQFVKAIKAGDVGIIKADNLFAKAQMLYSHRFNEGEAHASHAFYVSNPPFITEANGLVIKGEPQGVTFLKNIGDKTKCWFFRYGKLSPAQLQIMNAYAKAGVDTAGHYSVGGILQFAKAFITGKKDEKDEGGVFCSEFVSDIVLSAIPPADYIANAKTWQVTPTLLLNWMMNLESAVKSWTFPAYYDGAGNYFLS